MSWISVLTLRVTTSAPFHEEEYLDFLNGDLAQYEEFEDESIPRIRKMSQHATVEPLIDNEQHCGVIIKVTLPGGDRADLDALAQATALFRPVEFIAGSLEGLDANSQQLLEAHYNDDVPAVLAWALDNQTPPDYPNA